MRTYSWHSTGGSLNDQYDVTVKVSSLATVSGAPSSVTVTTPVVDFGTPSEVQISRLPAVGILDWRASNAPFGRDDSLPAWSNPTGEFRYWQARVTWTDPSLLLERIEFTGAYSRKIAIFRRFRQYWFVNEFSEHIDADENEHSVIVSGNAQRDQTGWSVDTDEERGVTVR